MRIKAIFLAVAALTVAGVAAGCGGSSNDNSTTTATAAAISKADFLAKGNQICKQGNDEINAAGKKLGNSVNEQQLEDFASSTVAPSVQKQIDGIKALGAPAGEEAHVNQLLSTAQADVDKLKADPSLIKDDNLFKDANQQANVIGLKECAG